MFFTPRLRRFTHSLTIRLKPHSRRHSRSLSTAAEVLEVRDCPTSLFQFNPADDYGIASTFAEVAGVQADPFFIFHDAASGTFVGRVDFSQSFAPGTALSFTIVANTEPAAAFSINGNGDILSTTAALDGLVGYPILVLNVEATDRANPTAKIFMICVINRLAEPGFSAVTTPFTPDFVVPENASGIALGPVSILVGGVPADIYELADPMDLSNACYFSFDTAGVLYLNTALDYESQEFRLVDIRGIDSTTGNSAVQTFLVAATDDVADPSVVQQYGQPKAYTADSVVNKLGWTAIPPTRFGDLNGNIQLALNNRRGILYLGDGRYSTPYAKEVKGPFPASSNHGLWENKLNELENQMVRRQYYAPFGVESTFKKLKAAAREVGFAWVTFTLQNASYEYVTNTIRLPFLTGVAAIDATTVLHETVHILDDRNGWYLVSGSADEVAADALAYGVEALVEEMITRFNSHEDYLWLPHPPGFVSFEGLRTRWYAAAGEMQDEMFDKDVVVNTVVVRQLASGDYLDIWNKIGLQIAAGAVNGIYAAQSALWGVTYAHPLSGVTDDPNNPVRNIHWVFQ